jgi:uncharacterized protein (TIGR03067 family)
MFFSSAWSGDEARKKADAAMLKKLTGTWELDRPGRKPSKFAQNGDVGWDIGPELIVITYHDGQTEQFQHKPFIDTSKKPMWLDLLYLTDQRVALGIFKLEGDRLIYVEGKHYPVKEWQKAKGDLPGRPKEFNVKKGDEDRKQVLLRSAPPVIAGTMLAQDRPRMARVRPDVLDQVEKELKRLADQAQREPKLLVTPAHEITYFLLVGLAERGAEVKEFTDSERREMRLGKSFEGKVVELMEGRRVVLGEGWMCFGRDGAAYRFAEYYARRHGKWVRIGAGKLLAE